MNQRNRKSIRLKGYDYSQPGGYFVTICTKNREMLFGDVVDGKMVLNSGGKIVKKCWFDIPAHFPNVCLDDFVIMPNHVHFLCAFSGQSEMLKQCAEWKRFSARQINKHLGRTGEFWQVDQFDHLVRNLEQFEYYRRYVSENPKKAGLRTGTCMHYQRNLLKT